MRTLNILLLMLSLLQFSLHGQNATYVVISEVYGGGGNSGAIWKADFVELYNPTSEPVNLDGWSVQYASSTGSTWQVTPLSGVIQPKRFFLIQQAAGTAGSQNLPAPDVVGTLAMGSTAGKIALSKSTNPVSGPSDPSVVDFVGYGSGTSPFEGTGPAPAPSNTTSLERKSSGTSTALTLAPGGVDERAGNSWDRNNNATDFVVQSSITPQNSASPQEPPPAIPAGTGIASCIPSVVRTGDAIGFTVSVKGTSAGTITGLRLFKNAIFRWSKAVVSATVSTGGSALVSTDSQNVNVKGFSLAAGDSISIRIDSLGAPDTTMRVTIALETAAGTDSTAPVTPLPTLVLFGTPRPIMSIKTNNSQGVPLLLQQPVTVRGIVTVANHFGGPAYMQDVSGGLAVYDRTFERSVAIGDEVTVTGTITQFNGLTELANITLIASDSRGNELSPSVVTIPQLVADASSGQDLFEGMLVQLNRVTVKDANSQPLGFWNVGGSGSNFWLHDGMDSVQVRIDADVTGVANTPAHSGEFDLVGVVGQFVTASPYIGGYQVMPRVQEDILSKGPIISVSPRESNITSASLQMNWQTAKPGTSAIRYGRTRGYELGIVSSQPPVTTHKVTLTGLAPATVYHVQAFSVSGIDTSFANARIVSTSSSGSTGQINVYFNKSVRPALARRDTARGNVNLMNMLVRRLDGATKSIDCCLYSISGSVGQTVASALVRAKNRGVDVRVIVEKDNLAAGTGTTFSQIIGPAGIPWIADDFDAINGGAGLMHNKFVIVDAGGFANQAWVWTGSWNLTDNGTYDDAQNAMEVQDQALAKAYTMEFEEMWGSTTALPNAAASRFGARKLDNTPHVFSIGGLPVELYFSPSDRTTSAISQTLGGATSSVNFALLTFTRADLASTLKAKKNLGLKVRGVLDNGTDSGSQYSFLSSGGVDVRLKVGGSGLLHHKYAIVDAEKNDARHFTITGSHNWSNSAETSNNENTLIVESASVANQYLQEFAARYADAGGTDGPVVSVSDDEEIRPGEFNLLQNYPNPFNGTTNFEVHLPSSGMVTLEIHDLIGRKIATLLKEWRARGGYRIRWDAGHLPSGVYYGVLTFGPLRSVRAVVLMK